MVNNNLTNHSTVLAAKRPLITGEFSLMHEKQIDLYLLQCRYLSLTARMAIALLVFELFCAERQLDGSLITEFSEYMWEWPLIREPSEFDPWERARPELVNYGLGDLASSGLVSMLESAQTDESDFREMVGGVVEILWGSFWGAANDELSMRCLETVLKRSKVLCLPPLTPFKFSRFSDRHGWGEHVLYEDCQFWRNC